MPVTLADIQAAAIRISDGIAHTPCHPSLALSELTGARIYAKLDNEQRTGSFKERGARNALLLLDSAARARGVVAASAGNHALGLAYHGGLLGIPVTVVMPRFAPFIKVNTCRRLGAQVILHGHSFSDARQRADELVEAQGLRYINGFDDPAIIAGQGTMALEILDQVPNLDAIVVPVGGGGLIAGIAVALKALRPEVRIIGVESTATASFAAAMERGEPVATPLQASLADGLAVATVGSNAFALARTRIDQLVQVEERWIALAILRLIELEKGVVEGAAATPLAALMAGLLPDLQGRRVVLPLCGGNIDPTVLSRVIENGLVADGRLCRFTAKISDRPGGLAHLAGLIASTEAAVQDIFHDRAFAGPDVSAVDVTCIVETRDAEHIGELFAVLRAGGVQFRCDQVVPLTTQEDSQT